MATQKDLRLDAVSRYTETLKKLKETIAEVNLQHESLNDAVQAKLADSDFYETVDGKIVPNALGYLNDEVTNTGGAQLVRDALVLSKQITADYLASKYDDVFRLLIR